MKKEPAVREPMSYQRHPMFFISSFIVIFYMLGAGIIGCGEPNKNRDRKSNSSTGTATGTVTQQTPGGDASKAESADAGAGADKGETDPAKPTDAASPKGDAPATPPTGGSSQNVAPPAVPTAFRLSAEDFPKQTQGLGVNSARGIIEEGLLGFLPPYNMAGLGDACLEELYGQKLTVDDNKARVSIDRVGAACGSSSANRKVSLKAVFEFTCSKDFHEDLIGKSLRGLSSSGSSVFEYCRSATVKHTMYQVITSTSSTSKGSAESTLKLALMTASGEPCSFKTTQSSVSIQDGCQFFRHETKPGSQDSSFTVKSTLIGSFEGASGSFSNRYLGSGELEFSMNNWRGDLNFDYAQKPRFEMQSEDDTESGRIP